MATGEDLKVQVMMVGGRRCGKTSILAAMKANFEEQFAETKLTVAFSDLDTLEVLEAKNNEIADYFLRTEEIRTFTPDSNPTEEMMRYSYSIGIAEKRGKIKVDFVDYPGEWLTDKEHNSDLLECMKNTHAIIVAIDTPHLMEEGGRFNQYRNFCRRTGDMLKMALEEMNEKRLILFVPLKCERYLSENKMEEVRVKTEEAYKELISYLSRSKNKYEVAVTPIFTLGGAEFSHFERDKQTGEIKINEKFHTPERVVYYFPDITVKKPDPKYCEQPIVYLLAYLMQQAGEKKATKYEQENMFGKLGIRMQEWFFHTTTASDYLTQKDVVLKKLKKQDDGYHIVQNPMKF